MRARDVYLLHTWGYDVYGVDVLEENISLGKEPHQEIAEKLQVADLREPLTLPTLRSFRRTQWREQPNRIYRRPRSLP